MRLHPGLLRPVGGGQPLYLFGPRWHYMIGLPDNRHDEDTGELWDGVPVFHTVTGRWDLTRGQRWTRKEGWYAGGFRVLVRSPRDKGKQNPLGVQPDRGWR